MAVTDGVLETIEGDNGSVTIGWVHPKVLYARFTGELSVELGVAHLARMRERVRDASALKHFSDASGLTAYDLLARSDFVRFILVHRRRFTHYVTLTWGDGHSAASRAFASAIGEPIEILTDRGRFEKKLVQAAPLAHERLRESARIRTPSEIMGGRDRQRL